MGDHETEPTKFVPYSVRVLLIMNTDYRGFVEPSDPVVKAGDYVEDNVVTRPPTE